MDICNYKELTKKEISTILKEEKMCYLATTDTTNIESVPMWYVFDYSDEDLVFYFISNTSSQKIDNTYYTGIAGITLSQHYFSRKREIYKTIIGNGSSNIIDDIKEKLSVIESFKSKYDCLTNILCDDVSSISFLKVTISEITGREYS
ncbi:Predicted flavin-nucleotide-binding protein [uncultured Clostridium sp.]|uniref:pyridoxamine 5'-phosphate oxidase family protein n=1 Tax=uncultured Clostridium sp. TaxID=59620 RepID=UPI0008203851|nr:pyridoxamine 5'-phosphate oxidase family protein [uncultured Clostridium sp.]SCI82962.1 Predicted flavin-nucleotide-binding protein [uncultured Clostridium sp.]